MLVTKGSLGLFRESMSTLKEVLVTTSILYAPKNLNTGSDVTTQNITVESVALSVYSVCPVFWIYSLMSHSHVCACVGVCSRFTLWCWPPPVCVVCVFCIYSLMSTTSPRSDVFSKFVTSECEWVFMIPNIWKYTIITHIYKDVCIRLIESQLSW